MSPIIDNILSSLLPKTKAFAPSPLEVMLPKKFNILEFAPSPKSIILSFNSATPCCLEGANNAVGGTRVSVQFLWRPPPLLLGDAKQEGFLHLDRICARVFRNKG